MKGKYKVALCTAALVTASALYGNHRFNTSRYGPQCDQIPNVCVYGSEKPVMSKAYAARAEGKQREVLQISYEDREFKLEADYSYGVTVSLMNHYGMKCRSDGPVQAVMGPFSSLLVKGCSVGATENGYGKYLNRYTYLVPMMGLKEMFVTPKPLDLSCAKEPVARMETTYACKGYLEQVKNTAKKPDQSAAGPGAIPYSPPNFSLMSVEWREGCTNENKLLDILSATNTDANVKCRAEETRERLIRALKGEKGYALTDENYNAETVVVQAGVEHKPIGKYWKGWDYLFGLGFMGAIAFTLQSIIRKGRSKKSESPDEEIAAHGFDPRSVESAVAGAGSAYKKVVDLSPEELERQQIKEKYIMMLQAIGDKATNASTPEEHAALRKEFRELRTTLMMDHPELGLEMKTMFLRLFEYMDSKAAG